MPLSKLVRSLSPFAKIKEFNEQREQMRKVKDIDFKLEILVDSYAAIDSQITLASEQGDSEELSNLEARLSPEARKLAVQELKAMKEYEKLYPTLTGKARKECYHMINGIPDPNNKNHLVGGYVKRLNMIKNNTAFLAENTDIIDLHKQD